MFEVFDNQKMAMRPGLDVYLPWEGHIARINNVEDAIAVVKKIIKNDPDGCWYGILRGLSSTSSTEGVELMRRELRREFLLRGMILPEDVYPGAWQHKARSWWLGMIDPSCQLEIELPRPLHA